MPLIQINDLDDFFSFHVAIVETIKATFVDMTGTRLICLRHALCV